MDAYLTADGLARIYHVPRGTIYRWACEDAWRRTRGRPVRYHTGDADTSYHKRHTKPAASLDTHREQQRSLACSLCRSVPSARPGRFRMCGAVTCMFGIVTNRQLYELLSIINVKADLIMAALDDLMAADQALKNEVATFLADLAGQISGGVTAAQAETVVADINAQVAALKAADPGPPPPPPA